MASIFDWLRKRLIFWRRRKPEAKPAVKVRPEVRVKPEVKVKPKIKVEPKRKARRVKKKVRLRKRRPKRKPVPKARKVRVKRRRVRRKPKIPKVKRIPKVKKVVKPSKPPKPPKVTKAEVRKMRSRLSGLERRITKRALKEAELAKLQTKIAEIEVEAERRKLMDVPELMEKLEEVKRALSEVEVGVPRVDPITALERRIDDLKHERTWLKEAKKIIKQKFSQKKITKNVYKKAMSEYDGRLAETEVKIKNYTKELKRLKKRVKEGKPIKLRKLLEEAPKVRLPKKKLPLRLRPPKPKIAEIPRLPKMRLPKIIKPKPAKKVIKKFPKEIVKELIVAEVMSKKPMVVRTDDPLSYVVRLLSDKKISGAPVVRGSNFVGVISESDIVKFLGVRDLLAVDKIGLKKLNEYRVSEAMHKKPIFVQEYTKLSEAADLMNKHDITRLPVLNERREIVGVLSRSDIVRAVSKEILLRMLKKRPPLRVVPAKIETDIDDVLKIVERKGAISIDEVKKRLMLSEDKIDEWGKILEKHELLELHYPTFGKPKLRKKLKGS